MIALIEHEEYYLHKMPNILENPRRLKVIMKVLQEKGFLNSPNVKIMSPERLLEMDLKTIHREQLIETIKHGSMIGDVAITGDTITNEHTFNAALRAVGGTKLAAETVLKQNNSFAFALVRPPGHHATETNAMGYCFFNNVAYTANYLTEKKKLKRIAIIDFDNHYGNGTADIFYERNDVLTISLHADPQFCFPFQGRISEIGYKEGEGYNICIPLPAMLGDVEYLHAFDKIVPPLIREYKPEIIITSAGYDGLKDDPYGYLALTANGYRSISERINLLAKEICEGKVVYSLEGGYKFEELGEAVHASICPFISNNSFYKEPTNLSSSGNKNKLKDTLNELQKILKCFWSLS